MKERYEIEIKKCEKRITDRVEQFISSSRTKESFVNSIMWDMEKRRTLKGFLEGRKNDS